MNRIIKIEHGSPVLLNRIDFMMYPARSMARFIQKVGEDFGDDFLYELGYDAGFMVGEEFVEKLGWFGIGMAKKMGMVFNMFEVLGFGKLDIKVWDHKNDKLLYRKTNHPVIEHAKALFKDKQKSCIFYAGIESAHWHNEMGVDNCHLIETQCIAKGAPFCEFSHNYFRHGEAGSAKPKAGRPKRST